jgi:selenium metabolism protein YedF
MKTSDTVILITSKGMGHGPEELQEILMNKYLQLLDQTSDLPSVICFYTDGVKLVTEASPLLEQLSLLEEKGVRLIACSTCLDFFNLADEIKVGIAGSMADILEAQLKAGKVITI